MNVPVGRRLGFPVCLLVGCPEGGLLGNRIAFVVGTAVGHGSVGFSVGSMMLEVPWYGAFVGVCDGQNVTGTQTLEEDGASLGLLVDLAVTGIQVVVKSVGA